MTDHADAVVRPLVRDDLDALRGVVASNDLFPPEMLDGMAEGFLGADGAEEIWLTLDQGGPVGLAYVAPERMTAGTWNLLLVAVHADRHDRGHGTRLTERAERDVAARGGRVLLVETSGLPAFERTRAFYGRRGYEEEARIRDFYDDGEDKVVFWKSLKGPKGDGAGS